ncbi:MAG: hypothetical protein JNM69_33015 [Archangium sp.]|nr:hypothetical protein [Archangium sp.]
MRDLRSVAVLSWCLSSIAFAEPAEDPCPLTEAKVTEVTGMKVTKKELRPFAFGVTQCVYVRAAPCSSNASCPKRRA